MANAPSKEVLLGQLLGQLDAQEGSDLHLTVGLPPCLRIDGRLCRLRSPRLTARDIRALLKVLLQQDQLNSFQARGELDFAFQHERFRLRGNAFLQRGQVGLVLRAVPRRIQSISKLGLPPVVQELVQRRCGLILITGPSGCGKSTTLSALVDSINVRRKSHILTIEDPIEFVHDHKQSIVSQREVHSDTPSFEQALRSALREDPDVVLVGEMRDLETIQSTLRIAETGHLTLSTLHTNSAVSTLHRIIDAFPADQQSQIRAQLSMVLEGVVCQQLIRRADGPGRVVACEILIPNPAIRHLIRENKIEQIYSVMQSGQSDHAMQTFEQDLCRLSQMGIIPPCRGEAVPAPLRDPAYPKRTQAQ